MTNGKEEGMGFSTRWKLARVAYSCEMKCRQAGLGMKYLVLGDFISIGFTLVCFLLIVERTPITYFLPVAGNLSATFCQCSCLLRGKKRSCCKNCRDIRSVAADVSDTGAWKLSLAGSGSDKDPNRI
uniref:Uncharacterized protein n=1 Tax=Photinus pyralis TaxID=7054 RepID=A0A1Y1M8G9_PHOPY